jgi:hypothetical protein
MRRLSLAAGLILVLSNLPSMTHAASPKTYTLTYGPKDLGTWDTLVLGKSKSGLYDGASFDSSNGPGFATVQLTRPLRAVDRQSLYSSLPPANGQLVVRTSQDGTTDLVTTCPKSTISDFGSTGDPGTGTEEITFACTSIVGPIAPN